MRSRYLFPSLAVLLCLAWGDAPGGVTTAYAGELETRVLILHSYHHGFTWTDEEMAGIMTTLRETDPAVEPAVEYMDWKRYPQNAYLESLYQFYRYKYTASPLRVVIVTDNAALVFALQYREGLFPQAAIVFCGINGFDDAQIAGYPEVTGVLESLDPRQTIQLALRFHPYNRHVVAIFDSTESSDPTVEACREALGPYAGQVQARFLRDLTMDHLLNEVEQLPPDSIILLGNFNRDKSGNTFSHEETLALIRARTKAPIYGLWDFLMGQGIVGGSLLSGRLQGATAARMALLVLNGTPVEAIPIVRNSPTRLVFDYRELSRFGIPFETLPPGSTVINQPEDSIGRYKGHVGLAATASSFY